MAQTIHTDGWTRYPIGEAVPKQHELTGRGVENLALRNIPLMEYLVLFGYIGVTETANVAQTFYKGIAHALGDHGIIKAISLMIDVVSDVGGVLDSVHAFRVEDQNGVRYAQIFVGKYEESTATFQKIIHENVFFPNLDIPFDDDIELYLAGDYANLTAVTMDIGANAIIYIQKQD